MIQFFQEIDRINPWYIAPFAAMAIIWLFIIYDWHIVKPVDEDINEGEKRNERIAIGDTILGSIFKKETFVVASSLLLLSCSQTARMNHYQKIHGLYQSGTYTIQDIRGDSIKLKGIARWYEAKSDTLKIGDPISIMILKQKDDKNSKGAVRAQ